MPKIEPDAPAYPSQTDEEWVHGLTIREAFIKAAMQGFCANPDCLNDSPEKIAGFAIKQADATIEAINKEAKP